MKVAIMKIYINKLIKLYIIFILSVLSSMSFANNHVYDELNNAITVTKDNPYFVIKLKSNKTTGYSWSLQKYDKKLIKLISHQYVAPATNIMGAPGYETFKFKALPNPALTKTVIQLIYAQPWQPTVNNKIINYYIIYQ